MNNDKNMKKQLISLVLSSVYLLTVFYFIEYVMTSPEVLAYFSPNLHVSVLHHSPSLVYSDECEEKNIWNRLSTSAQIYWDLKEQFLTEIKPLTCSFPYPSWLFWC